MKEKIFNTNFEVAMRILMLLNAFKEGLDEERILFFDFFTMYAKNYGFGNENINGESSYMINELTSQRKLTHDSIKELVLMGLIYVVNTKNGYLYSINEKGSAVCKEMSTDYAYQYKKIAVSVKETLRNKSNKEIRNFAREKEGEMQNASY